MECFKYQGLPNKVQALISIAYVLFGSWYWLACGDLAGTVMVQYSSNLLSATWPLCKNILSVDYERSISFRKCNRWKSFEIVRVCLNNKKCYNIQYDYDLGQWRLGRVVQKPLVINHAVANQAAYGFHSKRSKTYWYPKLW